ncbi:MAG: PfkB family carbohydrate kinase, partial [Rhodothermales bacterium]
GLAFLSILPPDTFPLVYYRPVPADIYMTLDDIAPVPFDQTRVLFVAGSRFSAEPSRSTAITAMERAREGGAEVILDIDLRATLWKDIRTFGVNMRTALPLVDIAIGTEDEITGAADAETVEEAVPILLERVHKAVAVKRGQDGSEVHTKDGTVHHAKPFTVDVLNVLGAGDSWASGFIYGYLNGWDWGKSARFGNATGAIVVTRHACANDMATLQEANAFIEEQGGL